MVVSFRESGAGSGCGAREEPLGQAINLGTEGSSRLWGSQRPPAFSHGEGLGSTSKPIVPLFVPIPQGLEGNELKLNLAPHPGSLGGAQGRGLLSRELVLPGMFTK